MIGGGEAHAHGAPELERTGLFCAVNIVDRRLDPERTKTHAQLVIANAD